MAEQTLGQQLGLLPVDGDHVVCAVLFLEGLTGPTLLVVHYDTDDLRKESSGHTGVRKCSCWKGLDR